MIIIASSPVSEQTYFPQVGPFSLNEVGNAQFYVTIAQLLNNIAIVILWKSATCRQAIFYVVVMVLTENGEKSGKSQERWNVHLFYSL